MLWRKLSSSVSDRPQSEINVGAGMALGFVIRILGYGLAAVTGVVVARSLGPHARGVYSLVTTTALTYASFSELGLSPAGMYVVGRKKGTLKQILSNNMTWLLSAGAVWCALNVYAAIALPGWLPDSLDSAHYLVFAFAGVSACAVQVIKDGLLTSGSLVAHSIVDFVEPFLRCLFVVFAVLAIGVGVNGVLAGWVLAIIGSCAVAAYLLAKRVPFSLGVQMSTFRQQLNFGFRGYVGWLLQSANYRLDVFLVAAFVGQTQLGYYAVAFGVAELLWQLPFALGTVFFPKIVALTPEENAEAAASTCRRALFITLLATIVVAAVAHSLIEAVYGSEFGPAVAAFYILAPSALFYTVHRVLSGALAGRGMPEATLYGGLVSVPIAVGLGVLLIPEWGIRGAAVSSIAAYAANALCILTIFSARTRLPVTSILFINRFDVSWSLQTARTFLARSEA